METLIHFGALCAMAALAVMLAKYGVTQLRSTRPQLAYARGGNIHPASYCGVDECETDWSCRSGEPTSETQLQSFNEGYPIPSKEVMRAPGWPGFMPLPDLLWLKSDDKQEEQADARPGDHAFDEDESTEDTKKKHRLKSWVRNLFEDLGSIDVHIDPQSGLTRRLPVSRDHLKRAHRDANKVNHVHRDADKVACSSLLMPDGIKKVPEVPFDLIDVTKGAEGSGSGGSSTDGDDLLNDLDKRRFDRFVTQFKKCSDAGIAFCVKERLKKRLPARSDIVERAYAKVYPGYGST